MVRVAVFASGTGTNLQTLIDHLNTRTESPARIALVVADRAEAGALERARRAGVPTQVITVSGRDPRAVAAETLESLEHATIGIIALAGYLRLVPREVIERYRSRILNIHPALLPSFGGKGMYGIRVHRAVLAAGCTVTGATVHVVDERYDEGKVIVQWPVPVLRGDTAESLAERVLSVEHILYPLAVEWLARAIEAGADAGAEPLGFRSRTPSPGFTLTESIEPIEAEVRRALSIEQEVTH